MQMTKVSKKNQIIKDYIVQTVILRGARWFYWIAGLSAVNSLVFFSNGNVQFPTGLFITQIIDVFAKTGNAIPIGIGINSVIIGLFVWVGYQANKLSKTAFVVGLILYLLDLAILILFMIIGKGFTELAINVVFHLLALKSIYNAVKLLRKKAAESTE
jgi:hypothetical protein